MYRHLVRENRRRGGALLCNIGHGERRPRWTVSEGALKALLPQWFSDPEALHMQLSLFAENDERHDDELEALRSEVRALRGMVSMLVERLGPMKRAA